MSVSARKASPSRCGLPQGPVKGVPSTLNLGSPSPDRSPKDPEGLVVC